MKFTHSLYLLAIVATAFTACSKEESAEPDENGTASQKLIGTYDFLYLAAHTESDIEVVFPEGTMRTVSTSDYISKENSGTYTFTANEMIAENTNYKIDTTFNTKFYTDGVLDDEVDMPFTFSVADYDATSTYKLVGTDSIFAEGGFSNVPSGGAQGTPIAPSGTKFFWSGDTLTFYAEYSALTTVTEEGIRTNTKQYIKHATRLLKRQ